MSYMNRVMMFIAAAAIGGLQCAHAASTPMDHGMSGMDMNGMDKGFYGPYPMAREASGTSMFMTIAERPLGPGPLGLRRMPSLDPLMGAAGYPELLQTGESANGQTPLIDRQHPHDLFMELAATFNVPIEDDQSIYAYFGLPGERARGFRSRRLRDDRFCPHSA